MRPKSELGGMGTAKGAAVRPRILPPSAWPATRPAHQRLPTPLARPRYNSAHAGRAKIGQYGHNPRALGPRRPTSRVVDSANPSDRFRRYRRVVDDICGSLNHARLAVTADDPRYSHEFDNHRIDVAYLDCIPLTCGTGEALSHRHSGSHAERIKGTSKIYGAPADHPVILDVPNTIRLAITPRWSCIYHTCAKHGLLSE
jgi:hypothetical protein